MRKFPVTRQMALGEALQSINSTFSILNANYRKIPGSGIILRYIQSSYQHDPIRCALEIFIFLFAVRYFLSSKVRQDKNYIELSENEIDELVDDWNPDPLVKEMIASEIREIEKIPILQGPSGNIVQIDGKSVMHLASYNFLNLLANEQIKNQAVQTLRAYGIGACGPFGFYGTQDVHLKIEKDIANFLRVPACIVYAQAFATVSSVIPAFAKRGDIIIADKGINFSIQKGLQISRSTIKWFEHNDVLDLERVLKDTQKDLCKKPLTRRFIVTEGLFEQFGDIPDLKRIIELKYRYKYRLILDETWSIGVLGQFGRGCTEYSHVDTTDVDMIIGSLATSFCSGGGFCAGSVEVVEHQRISSISYVFSAALPAVLATTASQSLQIIVSNPSLFLQLRTNAQMLSESLKESKYITISSSPDSPIIHLSVPSIYSNNSEGLILQKIVDECLQHGILLSRAKQIPSQLQWKVADSIRICVTAGLSRNDIEKAVNVIKAVVAKAVSKNAS